MVIVATGETIENNKGRKAFYLDVPYATGVLVGSLWMYRTLTYREPKKKIEEPTHNDESV